jgi:hypothetical protein
MIVYSLWDRYEEPLFDIDGNEYIAKKGEQVDFYDHIGDDWVAYSGIVDIIQYDICTDQVTVNCIINQELSEWDIEKISNYNTKKQTL